MSREQKNFMSNCQIVSPRLPDSRKNSNTYSKIIQNYVKISKQEWSSHEKKRIIIIIKQLNKSPWHVLENRQINYRQTWLGLKSLVKQIRGENNIIFEKIKKQNMNIKLVKIRLGSDKTFR